VLRRVYAPGWATTDAILADHFGDGPGTVVVPVQHGTHTEDVRPFEGVDLERVPREVERSVKDKRVLQDDWLKEANAEEILPR